MSTYTEEMRIAIPVSETSAARRKLNRVIAIEKRTRISKNLKKCAASCDKPTIQLRDRKEAVNQSGLSPRKKSGEDLLDNDSEDDGRNKPERDDVEYDSTRNPRERRVERPRSFAEEDRAQARKVGESRQRGERKETSEEEERSDTRLETWGRGKLRSAGTVTIERNTGVPTSDTQIDLEVHSTDDYSYDNSDEIVHELWIA